MTLDDIEKLGILNQVNPKIEVELFDGRILTGFFTLNHPDTTCIRLDGVQEPLINKQHSGMMKIKLDMIKEIRLNARSSAMDRKEERNVSIIFLIIGLLFLYLLFSPANTKELWERYVFIVILGLTFGLVGLSGMIRYLTRKD